MYNSCVIHLMTRVPPVSTLFPYTTLFRSKRGRMQLDRVDERIIAILGANARMSFAEIGDEVGLSPSAVKRDRKSTRLNSSHVAISYAVFCLKKKKQKDDQETCNDERRNEG